MKILTNDNLEGRRQILTSLTGMIIMCERRSLLYIASPYLSEFPKGCGIIDLLGNRASYGADIKLLTAEQSEPSILFMLDRWSKQGVDIKVNRKLHGKIYLFQKIRNEFLTQHELILLKNWITIIGSANFTTPGLGYRKQAGPPPRLEIALKSYEKDIFTKVHTVFQRWWRLQESIPYLIWKVRRELG